MAFLWQANIYQISFSLAEQTSFEGMHAAHFQEENG